MENPVKRSTWRNGKKWTSRKAMYPEKASRARPPQPQRLMEYRKPRRTNVALHANRIVAVILCRNHRVKQLVRLTHHHGSTQVPKEARYHGYLQGLSRPQKLALANLSTQGKSAIFPDKLALPYPFDEILSGHEEDVSSIRDGFSAWVKTDPETLLKRHVVDAKGLHPAFREAPARRHELSSQEYRFMMKCPTV